MRVRPRPDHFPAAAPRRRPAPPPPTPPAAPLPLSGPGPALFGPALFGPARRSAWAPIAAGGRIPGRSRIAERVRAEGPAPRPPPGAPRPRADIAARGRIPGHSRIAERLASDADGSAVSPSAGAAAFANRGTTVGVECDQLPCPPASRDLARCVRVDLVQQAAAVDHEGEPAHEPGVLEQPKLSRHRGSAEPELGRDVRRPPGLHGDQADDGSARRIGEERNADPVPTSHAASMAASAYQRSTAGLVLAATNESLNGTAARFRDPRTIRGPAAAPRGSAIRERPRNHTPCTMPPGHRRA